MFRHSIVLEFVTFLLFYVLAKALFHFVNIEARRAKMTTLAGVTGLLA